METYSNWRWVFRSDCLKNWRLPVSIRSLFALALALRFSWPCLAEVHSPEIAPVLSAPKCESKLAKLPLFDANLVRALTKLSLRDRRVRHIPELVPELRKIQALNRAAQIRSQVDILKFGDQLVESKDLTYVNFWYYALIASSMRGPQQPMPDMNEFRNLYMKTLNPAIRNLNPRAKFQLKDIFTSMETNFYWFILSPPVPVLMQSRGVAIPLIDNVSGPPLAFYDDGAFADSFEPFVFPVGVTRSEDNDYDRQKNQSSAAVLIHDIVHLAVLTNQWNQLLRELHRSKNELKDLHRKIRVRLLRSPHAWELMILYEVLIHEPIQDAPVLRLIWQPAETLAAQNLQTLSVDSVSSYLTYFYQAEKHQNPDPDRMREFSEIVLQLAKPHGS